MISVTSTSLGETPAGELVVQYRLVSDSINLTVLNYGVRLQSLVYTGAKSFQETLLGYPDWQDYLDDSDYLGALVGPVANRITEGRFEINGQTIQLDQNDFPNHLHGGKDGFHNRCWTAAVHSTGVSFSQNFLASEGGYPGNRKVNVHLHLVDNSLSISYEMTSDEDTVVNICHHPYFNLSPDRGNILSHELQIHSDAYLPVDHHLLPSGERNSVFNSGFDFTRQKTIASGVDTADEQLTIAGGFDHCFILRKSAEPIAQPQIAAELYSEDSGIKLSILTTEPGIQFYTGNMLAKPRSGLCLETQHFPDSVNQANFPSIRLRAGNAYRSMTVFTFTRDSISS